MVFNLFFCFVFCFSFLVIRLQLCWVMTDLCDFFQLQASVGFEKTIQHPAEHLVENGTKVSRSCFLLISQFSCFSFLIKIKEILQGITKHKEIRKFHFPSRDRWSVRQRSRQCFLRISISFLFELIHHCSMIQKGPSEVKSHWWHSQMAPTEYVFYLCIFCFCYIPCFPQSVCTSWFL